MLYPGEIESRRAKVNAAQGIEVEDATWSKLQALAQQYGMTDELDLG